MTSRTAPTLEAVLDNRVRGSNPGKRRRRESPHGRRSVRRHPNHSAVGAQVQGAQLGGHERGHVDGRHQRRRRRRRRGSTAPMVVQSVATTGRPPRPLTGGILVSEQTADAERESRLEIGSVLRHAHHLRRRQGRRRRARPAPVRRFGARHPGAVHRARLIILLLVPGLGSVRTFALDRSGQANAGSSEIGPLALACEDGADSGGTDAAAAARSRLPAAMAPPLPSRLAANGGLAWMPAFLSVGRERDGFFLDSGVRTPAEI